MRLTHKQTDVGSVLHDGSCLMQQSSLADDERRTVDSQLTLLSNRWEELRLKAMDRQARFVISHSLSFIFSIHHHQCKAVAYAVQVDRSWA